MRTSHANAGRYVGSKLNPASPIYTVETWALSKTPASTHLPHRAATAGAGRGAGPRRGGRAASPAAGIPRNRGAGRCEADGLGLVPGSPGGEGGGRSQAGGSGQARGSGGGGERTPDTGQASGHGAAGKMTRAPARSSCCSHSAARSGPHDLLQADPAMLDVNCPGTDSWDMAAVE
ncbi:glycine-rich cell wall structural protein 2-like [Choloepus didactylus]|uniref:glycine-rich cell wall structural protein 2-like n=1 Tax=Choloepus didactylus TaxID=27675 RepID=UPI00189E6149|nr:glycine-rich cell wall structural protein 2-like [Choloepus didactylus]